MMNKEQIIMRLTQCILPIEAALASIDGLPEMFHRCFLNTVETTLQEDPQGNPFLITGDIPAMWLRDSSEQLYHYLRFAKDDPEIAQLVEGIIAKQAEQVTIDPYSNSFNIEANGRHFAQDIPEPSPYVWERKYEVDSLCHVIWLASSYRKITGSTAFMTDAFMTAMSIIVDLFTVEQSHELASPYRFSRVGDYAFESLPRDGKGSPVAKTGMIWSGFRPSDDACQYGYLIPGNLFAAAMLKEVAAFAELKGSSDLAERARKLSSEVSDGIARYGTVEIEGFGRVYAYEVDGLGHALIMDDGNIPSLLSLPFIGVCDKQDPLYQSTRKMCLSEHNPYFYQGSAGAGIGSPHTPADHIWPLGLCVQALTSDSVDEQAYLLNRLLNTTAGTGLLHESFHKDDPTQFTRPWFAWANSMFAELILQLYEEGTLNEVLKKLEKNV